jgi:NAD(P)-dependent dehydrogenase (short-subunit alcohol dehydrogenase family)
MTETVMITGASGGIGRATARLFGERGASVGLIARGDSGLAGAAADVEEAGGKALAVPTDVASYSQVEDAARQVEEHLGPIDTWINVAFSSVFAPFADIRPDEFGRVTEVSYLGFVYGTMAALARMKPRDQRSGTGASRCSPPTAGPSTRSTGSPPRCAASCCTSTQGSGSQSCRCQR